MYNIPWLYAVPCCPAIRVVLVLSAYKILSFLVINRVITADC